jgi:hypothetical protein
MTRAQRLLTLAYKAHQRSETEIAGRIVSLAFAEPDVAAVFEKINATENVEEPSTEVERAEAALRAAEASTSGNILSEEGTKQLMVIAEKVHKAGLPKVAAALARTAS